MAKNSVRLFLRTLIYSKRQVRESQNPEQFQRVLFIKKLEKAGLTQYLKISSSPCLSRPNSSSVILPIFLTRRSFEMERMWKIIISDGFDNPFTAEGSKTTFPL